MRILKITNERGELKGCAYQKVKTISAVFESSPNHNCNYEHRNITLKLFRTHMKNQYNYKVETLEPNEQKSK